MHKKSRSGNHCITNMSIIPSKNNFGGILILGNSVFNGFLRNFTEFRNLIPAELKNYVKYRRNYNFGGILILRKSVFNGFLRNFTELCNFLPAELKNYVKYGRISVVQNSAGHSNYKTYNTKMYLSEHVC